MIDDTLEEHCRRMDMLKDNGIQFYEGEGHMIREHDTQVRIMLGDKKLSDLSNKEIKEMAQTAIANVGQRYVKEDTLFRKLRVKLLGINWKIGAILRPKEREHRMSFEPIKGWQKL